MDYLPFHVAASEETNMCEHCGTRRAWKTELDKDEFLPCEYLEDLDHDGCPAQATALITGRYVEDHLCLECAEKETDQFDEEPGGFLSKHGFQKGLDYLAIAQLSEECTAPSCSNPARYAKMVIETWGYCENHMFLAGYGLTEA